MLSFMSTVQLRVSSPAFGPNTMIPTRYTCEGENTSPALMVQDLPKGTKTLALIVHDPDAAMKGGFTHWVAFNIDPVTNIPQEFKGGVQALNGANKLGYMGPCPPSGTHHYHFMVYALDTMLNLPKETNKDQLEKAMVGHILAQGEVIGLYKKANG